MEQDVYDLKKGIDFTGITCVFYCTDGKGNILLQKRSANCRDEQGKWDPGGGSMEFYEDSFESVAIREINEEYCVEVKKIEFCGVRNILRENNGIKTHWIAIVFAILIKDPENAAIGEPEKADAVEWFPIDKLPDTLHSQFATTFELAESAMRTL